MSGRHAKGLAMGPEVLKQRRCGVKGADGQADCGNWLMAEYYLSHMLVKDWGGHS